MTSLGHKELKKILLTPFLIIIIASIYLLQTRYLPSKTTIGPAPFEFTATAQKTQSVKAPILIVGDTMGFRLSKFKEVLEKELSANYTDGIKVETIATEGESIYRTLHKIQNLKQLPLIILLLSNYDTARESVFRDRDILKIKNNIQLYKNEYIKTALMIFPELAKIIYEPVKPVLLSAKILNRPKIKNDTILQNRKLIHYSLYEFALEDMYTYTKKANSLIINLTTPLNLSIPPTKSCDGSISSNSLEEYEKASMAFAKKDFKLTYNLSKELVLLNPTHAESQFLLSQSAFKLRHFNDYKQAGELAISLDCSLRSGDPVFNSIMKKLSTQYEVPMLNFHKLLIDQSQSNYTFIEDIYPQDLYFEKVINTISKLIKKRLRLTL